MKLFKSLILIISILVCGLSFAGCESDAPVDTSQTGTKMIENPDSLDSKEKKEVMDSISKLTDKFAEVKESISMQETEITELKRTVTDTKKSITLLSIIAVSSAVIALILACGSIYLINKLQTRITRHRNEIEDLKSKVLIATSGQQSSQSSSQTSKLSKDYDSLVARVQTLEHKVALVQPSMHAQRVAQQAVPKKVTTELIGYFGIPSKMSETEGYFKKLINSASDSDVRFSATIKGNHAEFKPREGESYLGSFKSSETFKLAVTVTGCLLSEATAMNTVLPGQAELIDSRWVITRKAIINLQ